VGCRTRESGQAETSVAAEGGGMTRPKRPKRPKIKVRRVVIRKRRPGTCCCWSVWYGKAEKRGAGVLSGIA
jgi:hypothetical protein